MAHDARSPDPELEIGVPVIDIPKVGTIIPKIGISMKATPVSQAASGRYESLANERSSLADALFTSTQQKVLGLLFGQPDRSFFVTQIMALANAGRGAVQRELHRLDASGLATVHMVGTQKHYQANHNSPLFDELCGIVRKTMGLEAPLQTAVASLPGNVILAMIYGSVAKGSDTSASDIDLLIVADELRLEDVYAVLAPAENLLDRQVNPTLFTPDEFARRRERKNPFLMRVLDGSKIILTGSIDAA